jgi:hypothetical protein
VCSHKRNWLLWVLGLNTSLENPSHALQRRPRFKVSDFKFALFPNMNLKAWMWTLYKGTRNGCITTGGIRHLPWAVFDLLAMDLMTVLVVWKCERRYDVRSLCPSCQTKWFAAGSHIISLWYYIQTCGHVPHAELVLQMQYELLLFE